MSTILIRIVSTLSVLVATYALMAYVAWPLGAVLHPEVRQASVGRLDVPSIP